MAKTDEHILKDGALTWARVEAKANHAYWCDRATNGSGLIQQIAVFVLKQAAERGKTRQPTDLGQSSQPTDLGQSSYPVVSERATVLEEK